MAAHWQRFAWTRSTGWQFLDAAGERWLRQAMEDALANRRTLFDEVVGLISTVTARRGTAWEVELVLEEG